MPVPLLDLTPTAAAALARVLRTGGVTGLQMHAGKPVHVGVHRDSGTRWFVGPTLAATLDRAADAVGRVIVEED